MPRHGLHLKSSNLLGRTSEWERPIGRATPQVIKPQIKNIPAIYTNPPSGRQMYDAYCASCHGQGGKGNGPAAPALKVAPTDMTQLAAKNGGIFPENHVAEVIKGDS